MQNLFWKTLCLTSAACLLSACGGGGDTGGVMGVSSQNLIGVNAQTESNSRVATLVSTTATASDQDGLRADFGGYTFASSSGFVNGTVIEDGNTFGLLLETELPTQTDLRLFDGAFGDGSDAKGIFYGILGVSPPGSVPASGTATWRGDGFANLIRDTGRTVLGIGNATVTAAFPGTLSAEISGLTGPVDAISLNNMSINGNRFTGTQITTARSGADVNVVGANGTGAVSGIFSGAADANGAPDEVGALFQLTGDDATLIGGFIAD